MHTIAHTWRGGIVDRIHHLIDRHPEHLFAIYSYHLRPYQRRRGVAELSSPMNGAKMQSATTKTEKET